MGAGEHITGGEKRKLEARGEHATAIYPAAALPHWDAKGALRLRNNNLCPISVQLLPQTGEQEARRRRRFSGTRRVRSPAKFTCIRFRQTRSRRWPRWKRRCSMQMDANGHKFEILGNFRHG